MKSVKYENMPVAPCQLKPWAILVQADNVYTLYGIYFMGTIPNGCASNSGYEPPSLDSLAPGAYYVDTTPVDKASADLVSVNGPVLDVQLKELTTSRLDKTTKYSDIVEAINAPTTLASLTLVSLDIYVQIWRALGARIGRKVNDQIEWEKPVVFKETVLSN